MPPEAPFYFAIAGVSTSLAGLAGLVAGLRRGTGSRLDIFRLREIVEFAFASALLALSTFPISTIVGQDGGIRVVAVLVLAYTVAHVGILVVRSRRDDLERTVGWAVVAVGVDVSTVVLVVATVATGAVGAFEALLLVLVARPMAVFLLVLSSSPREP